MSNELVRILREMETRAPNAAVRDPNTYLSPGSEVRPPRWDAERAITEGYLKQTYVFAGVNKTSDAISQYPFRAGRNIEDKTKFTNTNPLAKLLGPGLPGPNDEWAVKQFWRYTISQYILTGKFVWLIERAGGNGPIIGLWPLQAQHVIPLEGSNGSYFSGFKYGSQKKFRPDEIIYCWDRSQQDFRQPQSWLEASALDISIAQMVDQFDYALLKNNAVPSTLITTERFAEPGMRRAFRQQFNATFGGPMNSGKTMFLEADPDQPVDGATVNNVQQKVHVARIGLTPQELMTDTKRNAVLADVSIALRIPMSVLGDSTRSKDSNMEMDKLNWWSDTLIPLSEDIADHVNTKLVPLLDNKKFVGWFDFSKNPTIQPRPRFSAPEYRALYESRLMERDEVRKELGLAPWDEIDHPEPEEPLRVLGGPGDADAEAQQGGSPLGPGGPLQPVSPRGGTPRAGSLAGRPRKLDPGQVQSIITNQKTALAARLGGRRAKNSPLDELYDRRYWVEQMTPELGAEYAESIADIAVKELRAAASVEDAFAAVSLELRGAESIPLDIVATILDAIKREKIEPSKAVGYLWS